MARGGEEPDLIADTILLAHTQIDRTNPLYLTAPSDFTSSSLSGGVTEERYIPHWLAQPYFRPALPDNGQHDGSNKKGASIPVDTKDEQSKGEKRVVEEEEEATAKAQGEANKKVRVS